MLLIEAQRLADFVVEHLKPYADRIEVAGSIRRKRPEVHDIDIVLIPHGLPFIWPTYIERAMANIGATKVKGGEKLMQFALRNQQVDLYRASEEDWGMQLLRWTGSKEHNVKLCNRAISLGMKLAVSRGLEKDGKGIASRTEDDIFRALKMKYVPPEEREGVLVLEKPASSRGKEIK